MRLWRFFRRRRNSTVRIAPDKLSGLPASDALHLLSGAMFYRAWMGEPQSETERAAVRARSLNLDDPVAALDCMTVCLHDAREADDPSGMRGSMLAMKTLLGSWKLAEPANGLIATAIDEWYALELAQLSERARPRDHPNGAASGSRDAAF